MIKFSPLHNLTQLRLLVALTSLCLSFLINRFDYLMNVDGILYLNMAEAFISGGLPSASELYDWPFFSILIGLLTQYSWLGLQTSAVVLNSLLFVVLTDSLVLISKEGLRSSSQTAIAAVIILCFYTLNEYRDFIIRDVGYWAMTTLALYHFLKFIADGRTNRLILWLLFGSIAVLFRIEGLIVLALMPAAILFSERAKKFHAIALCYLPLLIVVAVLAILVAYDSTLWGAFSKIAEYGKYLHTEKLMTAFWQDKEIIANQVINPIAKDQAGILLISGLLGLVLHDIFTGLSFSLLALFALSLRTQSTAQSSYKVVITSFLLINLLILFSFTFSKQFITTRYCILAIIAIVLLMMPKITAYISSCIKQQNYYKIFLIFLLLSLSLVDTFHTTSSKKYIKDAIEWTAQNTSPELSIFTNDRHVAFHLAHDYQHTKVTLDERRLSTCSYDFVIIVEKHVNKRISKSINKCEWQLHKQFKEGSRSVKIYTEVAADDA